MASSVKNYQCPSCTGPLGFDAETGLLACEFCGSSYAPDTIEALYGARAEPEASAEKADMGSKEGGSSWSLAGTGEFDDAEVQEMRTCCCPSCGAELVCDHATIATSCPYCDNPTVIQSRVAGALRPDLVIPFKLEKDAAVAALKKHYAKRPFLPRFFKDENRIQSIKGIYVPFFLFDCAASGTVRFECSNMRTYVSGDERVTEIDYYRVLRSGSAAFSRIPIDASTKMPDDYMDSLEPFDYCETVPFSTAYLPGYMADRPDVSLDECGPRAERRAGESLAHLLEETVSGYQTVTESARSVSVECGTARYALLPVWVLNTSWNDESYLFAMNGQTGKIVGKLPVDNRKRAVVCALCFAASLIAALLVSLFGFGTIETFDLLKEAIL